MPAERIAWLKENAIQFRSIDPEDTDFEDLQPLKKLIGDAQIVQLGEQSHGDGTCFETKIRLIKFLHQEMGFDVLAFESGLYDCKKAWESFEQDEDPLTAAKDGVFGIWTGSKQTLELWNYLGKQAQTKAPLELAGFDCQFTAAASDNALTDDLVEFFEDNLPDSVSSNDLDILVDQIEEIGGEKTESTDGFDVTIARVIKELDLIAPQDEETAFWSQNLKSIRAFVRYKVKGGNENSTNSRDAQMARNLLWLKRSKYKDRKIIVWAASFHIMRNPSEIEVPFREIDYSNVVPMGSNVHQELGDQVFTIGFTANEGKAGAYFRKKFDIGVAPEGTLENVFSQAGIENGIVSLNPADANGAWLLEPQFSRPLGYTWMKARWGKHFDAMAFNSEMEPSTR